MNLPSTAPSQFLGDEIMLGVCLVVLLGYLAGLFTLIRWKDPDFGWVLAAIVPLFLFVVYYADAVRTPGTVVEAYPTTGLLVRPATVTLMVVMLIYLVYCLIEKYTEHYHVK